MHYSRFQEISRVFEPLYKQEVVSEVTIRLCTGGFSKEFDQISALKEKRRKGKALESGKGKRQDRRNYNDQIFANNIRLSFYIVESRTRLIGGEKIKFLVSSSN